MDPVECRFPPFSMLLHCWENCDERKVTEQDDMREWIYQHEKRGVSSWVKVRCYPEVQWQSWVMEYMIIGW